MFRQIRIMITWLFFDLPISMFYGKCFNIFPFEFRSKSIDFVSSSPKCVLTFLFTNYFFIYQSHMLEKFSFNCYWVLLISLCWHTKHESSTEKNRNDYNHQMLVNNYNHPILVQKQKASVFFSKHISAFPLPKFPKPCIFENTLSYSWEFEKLR